MREAVFLEPDPGKIRKTITKNDYKDMNKRRFSTKLKPIDCVIIFLLSLSNTGIHSINLTSLKVHQIAYILK